MERLLQYMDDIDDLVGAFGLFYEQFRRLLLMVVALLVSLALIASGVLLAIWHPPSALAACLLLSITLLYRSLRAPSGEPMQST
ncbi:MAG: hypothetical protein KJO95_00270 [Gammaproteobacteria bacterium]|nr:hypothetical protein [Gammaproteobacteria bacterium]